MEKYVVKTVINCNTSEEVSTRVLDNYNDAKEYFDIAVKDLVENYAEDGETLEDWLNPEEGIIVSEYGGVVSKDKVCFDYNSIEIIY